MQGPDAYINSEKERGEKKLEKKEEKSEKNTWGEKNTRGVELCIHLLRTINFSVRVCLEWEKIGIDLICKLNFIFGYFKNKK